jgi:hypothetical protein
MRNVTALLNVLAAPPLQPELSNLDITQEWLNENVASGLEASECRFTQEQKALFVSTFTNLQEVKAVLSRVLEPGGTDASPSVEIEILRNGETVWQLVSSSQSHAFMLPWVVIASEKSFFKASLGPLHNLTSPSSPTTPISVGPDQTLARNVREL